MQLIKENEAEQITQTSFEKYRAQVMYYGGSL